MKRALLIAAALGLSVTGAYAECAGHRVSASVDKDLTVASVASEKKAMSTSETKAEASSATTVTTPEQTD
ncbi:hypothetical protein L598_000200001080 [Mesorhizobium sp. J18]|uniref:hypothetical protein n=1 Tax=Mesorhizobium sp. J18 TaxID=935263 RepID=UPI00119C6C7D|nr:hypothetical protein [Mesorhizobium sp. J18]TWG97969.1 hypothetical protein L598_000200001080 [Mesorhizobium sp. J18]